MAACWRDRLALRPCLCVYVVMCGESYTSMVVRPSTVFPSSLFLSSRQPLNVECNEPFLLFLKNHKVSKNKDEYVFTQ